MGYKNKKSLVKQIEENLTNKLAIGESKHQAKRTEEGIKGTDILILLFLNQLTCRTQQNLYVFLH